MPQMLGRVMVIAGSDSGGGAGLQGDLKTITALGGYATTVVTAVTVQNTLGVSAIHPIPPQVVQAQGEAILDDLGTDAVKIGMLADPAIVEVAVRLIDRAGGVAVVVDPVMSAKGGATLLAEAAVARLKAELIPRSTLFTPNAPEAEILTGCTVDTTDGLRRAGEALLAAGARAVLMKGGHVAGARVVDLLITPEGETALEGPRIDSRHTHGTGCALASAVAALLAQGETLVEAVERARAYVQGAILHAPGFGAGQGPLDHGWVIRR